MLITTGQRGKQDKTEQQTRTLFTAIKKKLFQLERRCSLFHLDYWIQHEDTLWIHDYASGLGILIKIINGVSR